MPDRAIDALVRFARVVSDARGASNVLSSLGDALHRHVCEDGVAVYALEGDGTLRLAEERGLGEAARIAIDVDDVGALGARVRAACGEGFATAIPRPLVAGGSLFGAVVLLCREGTSLDGRALSLAEGLVDLAAVALETAAHVDQLERQYKELRMQQEILARTEKLRALGQMAAGISHDLKNILNPLSLHLQVIVRALDKGNFDDAKESAADMKQVLHRGVQTLERLREFSRQEKEPKTELVDLDRLAREAASIGKSRSASGSGRVLRIKEELASPAPVMAVSGEVVSAIVNLVVNAVDAGASAITLRSGEDEGGSWLEVADDGPGIPADVARRVFEPFFTTKGVEGTGLGLSMVYATMQRHGGAVTIDTAEGKGTAFRLRFPPAGPTSR